MTTTPLIDLINQLPSAESDWTRENRILSSRIFTECRQLIQMNADVINERDPQGNTPLHWATKKQFSHNIIRILLQSGADVNARNVRGDTPLHLAMFVPPPGNINAVEVLLEFNADNTIRNSRDVTPLELLQNFMYTTEEDIDFEEDYEPVMDALENHVVRPTEPLVQEYPEFAESPFWMKYSSTDEVECSICAEPLVDGTQVCLNANCQHGFHCNCIRPWLQRNNTCPVCRKAFLLRPLGELQQRALQNSFGKKRSKLGIKQLNSFKKYLDSL